MTLRFDPISGSHHQDPYLHYARLRDEAPLWWSDADGAWVLSRHADVREVLNDPTRFSSQAMKSVFLGLRPGVDPLTTPELLPDLLALAEAQPFPLEELAQTKYLIAEDPPVHTRMRSLVSRAFTPRRISALSQRIEARVQALVGGLDAEHGFDLVGDLANPLPTMVIAELLGVSPERQADFKRWSDDLMTSLTGVDRGAGLVGSGFVKAASTIAHYLAGVVAERRASPRDDLVSLLVAEGDEVLSPMDAVNFAQLLLVAGNETTTHLIGNVVELLLSHPGELAWVREDPARIAGAIEETLRFECPTQLLFRNATRDVELHGRTLRAGDVVVLLLGAANRDPRRFEAPDRFLPSRDATGHVSLGHGIHFCLGAALARMECEAVLRALLPRLPELALAEGRPPRVDSYVMRGPSRLPLRRRA